jgi:ATP-dependent helicase/nuclease subunit A
VPAVAAARQAALDENEHEYRRLLYVAMTRAAEHLIVCGCHGKKKPSPDCWYDLIRNGLDGQPGFEELRDGETIKWRYRRVAEPSPSPQSKSAVADFDYSVSGPEPANTRFRLGEGGGACDVEPDVSRGSNAAFDAPPAERPLACPPRLAEEGRELVAQESDRTRQQPSGLAGGEQTLPAWLATPAPAEAARSILMSPSSAYDEAVAPQALPGRRNAAHVRAQAQALARGTLIHRLLQSLPDIEPGRREAAAHSLLARAMTPFSMDQHKLFVGQALAIFADPRFAELFAPGSRAEVPIVGRLARTSGPDIQVSGQIDRLAITPHAVLIADYKTNRDPPTSVEAAPPAYVGQLALYRAVLAKIYPDRPIRAALVWTELPHLMELPAHQLDQAIARITSG